MIKKILSNYQRLKEDNNSDSIFYSSPRLVNHLDQSFRNRLTNLYRKRINSESTVLDLMSSWNSHLPDNINYHRVIGHGLNTIELENNKRLDSFWVQDLNISQKLPLDEQSIDVILIVASWQYLQYPEALALELSRVAKTNAQIIVTFSNRAFWTKATKVWLESSDIERLDYVSNVLITNGWQYPDRIIHNQNQNDLMSLIGIQKDPFFAVIATRR